jgi:thiamine kinase-like enzyme
MKNSCFVKPLAADLLLALVKNGLAKPDQVIVLNLLGSAKPVADDTIKYSVKWRNVSGALENGCVVLSNEQFPSTVAKVTSKQEQTRLSLSAQLKPYVLVPLAVGHTEQRSWVIWPFLHTLPSNRIANRLCRQRLAPALVDWLEETCRTTRSQPPQMKETFAMWLDQLSNWIEIHDSTSTAIVQRCSFFQNRLESNLWKPAYYLAHNDYWIGNILLKEPFSFKTAIKSASYWHSNFVIIDWGASKIQGCAVFDFLRLYSSLRIRSSKLRKRFLNLAKLLNCDVQDLEGYILAALGSLVAQNDQFPTQRMLSLVHGSLLTASELQS